MPIKKSSLEKKWYYRVAKILFLILFPLLFLLFFLNGKIDIHNVSYKNVLDLLKGTIIYTVTGLVLYYLFLIGIWRGFLYIVFGGLKNDTKKKGGQIAQSSAPEKSKQSKVIQSVIPIIIIICILIIAALSQAGYIKLPKINIDNPIKNHTYGASCTANGKNGLYGTNGDCYTCSSGSTAATSRTSNSCSNGTNGVYCCKGGNDGCIATGCGHMWYCSGSYYIGGQEIRVPGLCFPIHPNQVYSGWTGTCRQCP